MKPGIFKSSTALAVMISLAAPLPALSQNKGGKQIDLSQMSVGEISDLVDRCRKRAERTQKKLAAGQEVEEKTGKIAKFCKAYGTGAFDADLPGELQSTSVLASVAELTADADADVQAEAEVQASEPTDAPPIEGADTQPTEGAETQPQADAAEKAGTDTTAEADTESAPAPQTDAPAETPAADDVTEAADGSEATAEAIAADLAQSQEEADEGTDNPELAEIDSQA
ncbi:MAG: OmpA family protein, partial [Pseudomonadota bacterium]|nr:OmpA family protein [Pseudomonadota bacterium]